MLTKAQKKQIIEDLTDRIKRQKILIFTDTKGLKVGEAEKLRRKLKEIDGEYKVIKKTLIKLALEKAKKDVDTSQFKGSLSLIFGYSEPIGPAKTTTNIVKEFGKLTILGGLMDDKFLAPEEIKELALIPTRDELLARLINGIQAPISGFVNVLEGNIFGFVNLLRKLSDTNTQMARE